MRTNPLVEFPERDWKEQLDDLVQLTEDGNTKFSLLDVQDFIEDLLEEEIDKAREEGRQEGINGTYNWLTIVRAEATQEERKKILEIIEGMQLPADKQINGTYDKSDPAYNAALEELKKKIENL